MMRAQRSRMSELIAAAKHIGAPGSLGFLTLCVAVGLLIAVLGPRGRRLAKGWLLLVFVAYVIGALPFVSHAIAGQLPTYAPVWQPDGSGELDILVVLSGDNALGRAREARRVLDSFNPRCILVSGDRWFVRMIVATGVARDRVIMDNTTTTTREQIAKLRFWAKQCGAQRVVLIASTLSMPRVAALVRGADVPVMLAPSPLDEAPAKSGVRAILPSYRALRVTRDAFYEHVALAYYRHLRWIT